MNKLAAIALALLLLGSSSGCALLHAVDAGFSIAKHSGDLALFSLRKSVEMTKGGLEIAKGGMDVAGGAIHLLDQAHHAGHNAKMRDLRYDDARRKSELAQR